MEYRQPMFSDQEKTIPLNNLRTLLQNVSDGFDARLAGLRRGTRYESVRQSDIRVGFLAFRKPQTMAELARTLKISRQAVQMSVQRLRQLGVVELQAIPGNGRDKLVVMTDRGQLARQTAAEQLRIVEQECAAVIGADGVEKLRKYLSALETVMAPKGLRPEVENVVPPDDARTAAERHL
jgi:DNA-binding MarR family transcriptional regulator